VQPQQPVVRTSRQHKALTRWGGCRAAVLSAENIISYKW
jgi:hypothetical protein